MKKKFIQNCQYMYAYVCMEKVHGIRLDSNRKINQHGTIH